MYKMRKHKGITLVALIITIIVILILAVISIRTVTGDGIIGYAKKAKNEYEQAQLNEQALLDSYKDFLNQDMTFSNIPSYHYTEAERLISTLLDFKNNHPNSLIFGAISDNHITDDEQDKTSARHAAFALETVGVAACDFVANFGDNVGETNIESESAMKHAEYMLSLTQNGFSKIPSYRLVGNHDKSNNTEDVYNLNGIFNNFDDFGTNKIRGFGYKDWEDKKVRIICLNTTDYLGAMGGNGISYDQKDFLMRALDLSDKADFSEWQILLLSHIPLDFTGGDYNKYEDLQTILTAYENGTTATIQVNNAYILNETPSNYATYSNGNLVYSYSGKNAAKIIGNIHGHVHNNVYGKIANTNIVRIATANSNSGNKTESYPDNGNYSISSTEADKIKKVANSVKDTSATFYAIDLDNEIIYAFGYGADIDRVIPYKDVQSYTVNYNLTDVISSNTSTTAIEGNSFSSTLSVGEDYSLENVTVMMGGIDITGTAYTKGVIFIENVTGNIVITAISRDNYVPHWDIIDRAAVVDMKLYADQTKEFDRTKYYYGAARSGLVDYRCITECSISSDNDVMFTSTSKDVGIGLPYHLESGATYTFSATADITGRLGCAVFDSDGIFVNASYSSSGTNLMLNFTAPTDESQWIMLILECYTPNESITYTDISLTKN